MKMVFLLIIILIPVTFGWGCKTHNYICDKAGFDNIDCCDADRNHIKRNYPYTSSYYHHCKNNEDNCRARESADIYLKNNDKVSVGIYLHMLSDSMTPVHWVSTNYYECHEPFETMINEKIDKNNWNLIYDCKLKNGSIFRISMDKKYLDHVSEYIVNYSTGTNSYKESEYLEIKDCTDGCRNIFLTKILRKVERIIDLFV